MRLTHPTNDAANELILAEDELCSDEGYTVEHEEQEYLEKKKKTSAHKQR